MTRRRTLVAAGGWLALARRAAARAPATEGFTRTTGYAHSLVQRAPPSLRPASELKPRRPAVPPLPRVCSDRAASERGSVGAPSLVAWLPPRPRAATEAKGKGTGGTAAEGLPLLPTAPTCLALLHSDARARADAADGMARPAIEGHGGLRQYPVDSHRIPSISIV